MYTAAITYTAAADDGVSQPPFTLGEAFLELLLIHDEASARGQPLLTQAGVSYLRQRLFEKAERKRHRHGNAAAKKCLGSRFMPFWDGEARRLWLGDILLKEYRQPAPYQTRLLDVFQERGWGQSHIDHPLPPLHGETEHDAKRRLHDTIRNLNRTLPCGTIYFKGDGTGQGVIWSYEG